jgi:hypothetical protein
MVLSVWLTEVSPAGAHQLAVGVTTTLKSAAPKKGSTTVKRTVKTRPTTTKKKKKGKKGTTTSRPTTLAPTTPTTVAVVTDPSTIPPSLTTVPPVAAASTLPGASSTTTTTRPGPTTTLAPSPPPAAANPPTRPTAATLDPYRGLGTWVDRYDWTTRWSGKAIPPVTAASVDAMSAAGIQTIYIQAAHWSTSPDILEPEKLLPIIDRAHQLGMYVVVWYLPFFQDVNTDLRKTVAIANLDVDGINIDIEERSGIVNVTERNRRLIAYSAALRSLLPGRLIGNDIVATTLLDGASNFWPQANGQPKTNAPWWGGPFPFKEIAPFYDIWMIQNYWSERAPDSGWRDGYRYTIENVNRLRADLGRADVPIQVIGGLPGSRFTLNEFAGFMQAAKELGSVGISLYDWAVTPAFYHQYMWGFRWSADGSVDPRFVPVPIQPYVEQPRPTTTLPPPPTVPPATAPPATLPSVTLPPGPPPSVVPAPPPSSP